VTTTARPVVYLHIGEPKCGTTYLQHIAWRNRDELRRQGLIVPGGRPADVFRASQDLRELPVPAGDPGPSWHGAWDALVEQANRTPRAALISQEHLCGATEHQALRALRSLAHAEVHIVVTVRDFVSLLPAEWQETVKHRNARAWQGWLSDIRGSEGGDPSGDRTRWFWRAHDTMAVLRRWSVGIPAERVHVITVPQSRTRPTLLWERFAGVLGVDPATVDTTGARANATLGVAETEMLRRLNQRLPADLPQWFYAQEVKGQIAHRALAARPPGPRPQLPDEYAAWAMARGERIAAELAGSGYHIAGDLAELRGTATSAPATPTEPSDTDVLDAALDTLAHLLKDRHRHHPATRLRTRYRAVRQAGAWTRSLVRRRASW